MSLSPAQQSLDRKTMTIANTTSNQQQQQHPLIEQQFDHSFLDYWPTHHFVGNIDAGGNGYGFQQ